MRCKSLFQSTLPRGSDITASYNALTDAISIHAPSRERRFSSCSCCWSSEYFNPRSLAGATAARAGKNHVIHISIHAPSRERQRRWRRERRCEDISIHAPSRERQATFSLQSTNVTFQSTLPRGSDEKGQKNIGIMPKFQSTLPRGSDIKGVRPST